METRLFLFCWFSTLLQLFKLCGEHLQEVIPMAFGSCTFYGFEILGFNKSLLRYFHQVGFGQILPISKHLFSFRTVIN